MDVKYSQASVCRVAGCTGRLQPDSSLACNTSHDMSISNVVEYGRTHELSLKVLDASIVHIGRFQSDERLLRVRLPLQTMKRVGAFKLTIGASPRVQHIQCGKVLVRLEEQKELGLQRIAIMCVQSEDCRAMVSAQTWTRRSSGLLSQVLIALVKWPPSTCLHKVVYSFSLCLTGFSCFFGGPVCFFEVPTVLFAGLGNALERD
jgi:hypothetical protein